MEKVKYRLIEDKYLLIDLTVPFTYELQIIGDIFII